MFFMFNLILSMTIWDNIYKNYQKGGEAWASLSDEIIPDFKDFLEQNNFFQKTVFDIGCGTGYYLKFLQLLGFKVAGIDSSETAVDITKKNLNQEADIFCADMFDFVIPKDRYDLIISIAAIHHGKKEQIKSVIDGVYFSLLSEGKIFITLPNFESSNFWETFKNHEKIGDGIFAPLDGPEKGLAHSFFTREEVTKLFANFRNLKMILDERGRWQISAIK